MEFLKWGWAVLSVIFFVAEIFTAGFFLVCFGVGALAATLVAFLGWGLTGQMAAFVIFSAAAMVLVRPFANRVSSHAPNIVGIDRVLGKQAIVIKTIQPELAQGRVRVDREEWLADNIEGKTLEVGTAVTIIAVEGTRLKVKTNASK
jgi:membrane protein implicated in regulation of membrane protease activity